MENKLHKVLVQFVVDALIKIFDEELYSDKALDKIFKANKVLGARDRAFIAETTYNIVRYYRKYLFAVQDEKNWWKIIAAYFISKEIELPQWKEFEGIDKNKILEKLEEASKIQVLRESIPDWMNDLCHKELGKNWDSELMALNNPAPIVLRVNSLKTNIAELSKQLDELRIITEISAQHPDALIVKGRKNVFGTELFKNGFFEIQDASSQLVAAFMQVQPGMRVVDACAGAGGKSMHLASLMKNKGQLIALDTEEWKLLELRKRARRNGISIVEGRLISSNKIIKRMDQSADRLLLDVPCSGLGVLRRNPDAKWKLSSEFIQRVIELQSEILDNYSRIVKVGGKMVYATCSILPSENQNQIQKFTDKNKSFEVEEESIISPAESGFDGFFMSRLIRTKV